MEGLSKRMGFAAERTAATKSPKIFCFFDNFLSWQVLAWKELRMEFATKKKKRRARRPDFFTEDINQPGICIIGTFSKHITWNPDEACYEVRSQHQPCERTTHAMVGLNKRKDWATAAFLPDEDTAINIVDFSIPMWSSQQSSSCSKSFSRPNLCSFANPLISSVLHWIVIEDPFRTVSELIRSVCAHVNELLNLKNGHFNASSDSIMVWCSNDVWSICMRVTTTYV